jgi:predicted Rossmann-fold nucleotide-binding protein
MTNDVVDTLISPEGRLEVLSKAEVAKLLDTSQGGLYQVFRKCALAVLNSGSSIDDGKELLERYKDFDIKIIQRERGIKLDIRSAPAHAFVDGKMIKGIHEHLFSVLRDIVYVSFEVTDNPRFDLNRPEGITDAVFHILRNANVIQPQRNPNLVVCWGGHSINRVEYNYSKHVGYQLGLRELDICTGCGPGAMKGPMKGATIGHAKQRLQGGRYLGISEPGIIAAESPNPIVNDLVIMPDIEKRLEAFVRTGHGIVVFPGGAGTAEEILYILGILLHPENADVPFPLVFTGPASAKEYFEQIDQFIGLTLGEGAKTLPDHRRRSGSGGAGDAHRDPPGARIPQVAQRRLLLQLGPEDRPRIPAPVPPDPRKHAQPAALQEPGNAPAGREPAPCVLGRGGRECEGRGDPGDREVREVRDPRRGRDHGADGQAAAVVRGAEPDEVAGEGIYSLLSGGQIIVVPAKAGIQVLRAFR